MHRKIERVNIYQQFHSLAVCYIFLLVLRKLIRSLRTPTTSNVIGQFGKYMFPFAVSLFPNTYRRYIFRRRQYMVINFPYRVFSTGAQATEESYISYHMNPSRLRSRDSVSHKSVEAMCQGTYRNVRWNKKKTTHNRKARGNSKWDRLDRELWQRKMTCFQLHNMTRSRIYE